MWDGGVPKSIFEDRWLVDLKERRRAKSIVEEMKKANFEINMCNLYLVYPELSPRERAQVLYINNYGEDV